MFKLSLVQSNVWSSRLPAIVDRESYSQLFLNHPTLWVLSSIIFLGLGVFVFITNYQKTTKNSSKKEDAFDSSALGNSSKPGGNGSKTVSNPTSTTGSIWTSMMDTPTTHDTNSHSSVNSSHDSGSSSSNDSSSSDSGGSSSD